MVERKSKIINPEWEELSLKYYFVYDDITAIVAWRQTLICENSGVKKIIDMDDKIRLQNCSINGEKSFKSYYITRKEYEEKYKSKTTIYSQEDYWIYMGELKEKTEDDKKTWYMK